MNKKIKKLKKLVDKNLRRKKQEIFQLFGTPSKRSDDYILFYERYTYLGFIRDVTSFILEENTVVDIYISRYFLGKEIWDVFYYEEQEPEYKLIWSFKY
ncbi:hypothetical protein [Epilithonimonas hungarica]|uniref:Uncharacterized protein n=1 Tax=Epilithonimonas hungarica TaxID=454006 RepID=A0A1G7IB59_9FLAO|nr:hypothetical protein [Epilithonimonas hungarica]SDF09932.1 hypothetical protein SAMN05421825_1035 [Epilithonimonas hungarica]